MNKLWIYIRCILILFIFITFMPKNSGAVLFPVTPSFADSFSNASIGLPNTLIGSSTSFLGGSNTFNNFVSPLPGTGFGNFPSTSFFPTNASTPTSFISSSTPFSAFSSSSFGAPAGNLWSNNSNTGFGSFSSSNTSFPGFTSNTGLGSFSGITSSSSNSFAPSFGAFNTTSSNNFSSVPSFNSISSSNFSSAPSFNSSPFSSGTSFGSSTTFLGGQSITNNPFISQNQATGTTQQNQYTDLSTEVYSEELSSFEGIWVGTWSAYTDVIINENTKEREKISGDIRFELYESQSSKNELEGTYNIADFTKLGGTMQIYGWDFFAGEIASVECSLSPGGTILAMFADYKNLEILVQINISESSIADRTFGGQFNLMNTNINPRSGMIEVHK